MSLKLKIKEQIVIATKAKKEHTKNVLKVVLGDIDMQEVRNKNDLTDGEIIKIVRKTLQGVEEMLSYKSGDIGLEEEKAVLSSLLPKQLSKEDVLAALGSKVEEIKSAKSDGQATGLAMKHFKESKLSVDGTLVAEVIKDIRK